MSPPFLIPPIPAQEMTATTKKLLAIIEEQQGRIIELRNRLERLDAEVARLKKLSAKPKIRPSSVNDDDSDPPPASGGSKTTRKNKRPGSKKRRKRPRIHRSVTVQPEVIPEGARFLGYQDYIVQDLIITPCNTQYRLARYQAPDGQYLIGRLPAPLQGSHFGPTLRSYILYQYHHQRVTQPLLRQQLHDWGIDLSSGQLNRIITENNDCYHDEKQQLLTAGLMQAHYLHVDDTGARHAGQNGYCTHIGNEQFAYFKSTDSKSRVDFLEILNGSHSDYVINAAAIDYMTAQGLPTQSLQRLTNDGTRQFADATAWSDHLKASAVERPYQIRIATEGALIGSLVAHGLSMDLVIMSDDAGQFNVFRHALCWCHAERVFQRILPLNELNAEASDWVISQLWALYQKLKTYQMQPTKSAKRAITAHFDRICRQKTQFQTLNQALKRLANNKAELLLVLEDPDIPLTNNLSERDIREYVIKRKISGSTRSELGRKCRDTFASLKKTCQKQGVSFWDYLIDRTTFAGNIPPLGDLINARATIET